MRINFTDDKEFETETRRIARILWGPRSYSGPITVDGKERDGIFENDESIRCIEVTTSRNAPKIKQDCDKLDKLVSKLRGTNPSKGVTGWLITRHPPTGEQGTVLANYKRNVNHKTFNEFFGMLIDSNEYLNYRNNKPFGSARASESNSFLIDNIPYVRVSFYNSKNNNAYSFGQLAKNMQNNKGKRYLLLGEYGVGKSMALIEFYKEFSRSHRDSRDVSFPLYINLRDHSGEIDPDMCIRKHAQSIGYSKPDNLIKAWRSGYVYLILDGFDEMTPRVATRDEKRARDLRADATTLVKRFVSETPDITPIILAGRTNYFDRDEEMFMCTGVSKDYWDIYYIDDFSDTEAQKYLDLIDYNGHLPAWLPKKPLLISYLVSQRVFDEDMNTIDIPSTGWNFLIDRVCQRELEQVHVALEVQELRRIYGRIATFARRKADPRGPISFGDCKQAFLDILEVEPEDRNVTALLRLPGLSGNSPIHSETTVERGSRWFVERDFADAVASEDLHQFLRSPYQFELKVFHGVHNPASDLMIDIAVERLDEPNLKGNLVSCINRGKEEKSSIALYDVFRVVNRHRIDIENVPINIENMEIRGITIEDNGLSYVNIVFENCYMVEVEIFCDVGHCPSFKGCQIEKFSSHLDVDNFIKKGLLDSTTYFEKYEKLIPDSDHGRASNLSIIQRIRCSIFEKIFIQSKSGRIEGALYRGFPSSLREKIREQVALMVEKGWVFERRLGGQTIYHPTRGYTELARQYVADPSIKLP